VQWGEAAREFRRQRDVLVERERRERRREREGGVYKVISAGGSESDLSDLSARERERAREKRMREGKGASEE
jgi:hypothetical protein